MTLREIGLYADGFNETERTRWKEQLATAYYTAALVRTDKFPRNLSDFLEAFFPRPETPKQKSERIRARMDAWITAANASWKREQARAKRERNKPVKKAKKNG